MSPCTGQSHASDLKAAEPCCALCSATYALRSYLYLLAHTLIAAPAALWLGAGSGTALTSEAWWHCMHLHLRVHGHKMFCSLCHDSSAIGLCKRMLCKGFRVELSNCLDTLQARLLSFIW